MPAKKYVILAGTEGVVTILNSNNLVLIWEEFELELELEFISKSKYFAASDLDIRMEH